MLSTPKHKATTITENNTAMPMAEARKTY